MEYLSFFEIISAILAMIFGGFIGLLRQLLIILISVTGYFSLAIYSALYEPIMKAFMFVGFEDTNASILSLVLVFVFPLVGGIVLGGKLIAQLWFLRANPGNQDGMNVNVADKVLGAGLCLVICYLYFNFIR